MNYDFRNKYAKMEHPTEAHKSRWLKDHPNADPENHTVKEVSRFEKPLPISALPQSFIDSLETKFNGPQGVKRMLLEHMRDGVEIEGLTKKLPGDNKAWKRKAIPAVLQKYLQK